MTNQADASIVAMKRLNGAERFCIRDITSAPCIRIKICSERRIDKSSNKQKEFIGRRDNQALGAPSLHR